jgi:DNA-3-methyladenine glycosylase II
MRKALEHIRSSDPKMAAVIDRVGRYSIAYRDNSLDTLARSIVSQQVSTKAAATIYGRLLDAAGVQILEPSSIVALGTGGLRGVGLSGVKASYLLNMAEHNLNGQLHFPALPEMSDEEVIRSLTAVKGIGVWTAQMFLMFALRRPDVLATGDLGLQKGMQLVYKLRELPDPKRMQKIAAPWQPFRSIACWYLWRAIDGTATL